MGISGGVTVMESFLKTFFPSVLSKMADTKQDEFDSQVLTAFFTSSLYIAGFASSLVAYEGRWTPKGRSVMLLGGVTFLVGMAIDAAVVNIEMLILGRLLLGVGVGFINQAVPVSLAETASTKWRGVITTGVQLFIAIGVVAANVTNYGTSHISTAWIIPTEIFRWISSRRDRASAWPSTWASQAFLAMLCSFKYGTFIFYAAWIVVMTAFVAVFLPETKRVPLEPWMRAIGTRTVPRR
ncbi:hypothetical protein OPV22_011278 [Ensete ventricosum]|uniref:Major facilitator superfamily (MFS) profile domain-containing protein n=1 Tax=Ensete ventricosum TaxID=4639 RepID=A0AAV8RMP9_ENSVE|nr:hypothetical protein OPV22_011278 [Ensete ventricosum]